MTNSVIKQISSRNYVKPSSLRIQLLASFTATLSSITCGIHYGWSSPSLPQLFADNSPIPVTGSEGSWLAIMPLLGAVIGAIIASYITDLIGRKPSILLTAPIYFTSWMIIVFAESVIVLCVARLVAGFADGITFTTLPIYLGEIAESRIRGALGASITVTLIVGTLFVNAVGPYVSIPMMAYISATLPIIQLITFSFMPESPYYLLVKDQPEKAKKALQRLRSSKNVDVELDELKAAVKRQVSEPGRFYHLVSIPSNRKALLITIGLRSFQQLSGITAFVYYTQYIFQQAGTHISPEVSAIIYTTIQLAFCVVGLLLVDKWGRRPLLLISTIGSGIALIVEGVYFFLKENSDVDLSGFMWLPVTAMLVYIIIYSFGLGVIPVMMLGEMFPTNVKTNAVAFMDIYFDFVASVTTKLFQMTADHFGIYVPFFIFAFCCLVSILFMYYCVPETKGKTLEEIQLWLKNIEIDQKKANKNVEIERF